MTPEIVYLDYAATTPVDSRVAEHMATLMTADGVFANPSSPHIAGWRASEVVDEASAQLAALVGCRSQELIWTSGATEADNLAIHGAAKYREPRGKHLMTMPTEHKAVSDAFQALDKRGFDVTWLEPEPSGRLDLDTLKAAFRDDTQLVSIMYVNNETGVLQDIEAIGQLCRERDVLYHVDAAQAVGKLPLTLSELPVDLASMTAHKFYGPKGIGALYIADRPGCHVEPLLFGGGQQKALRPGTLPVHLIGGFGCAAGIAAESIDSDLAHVRELRERLWEGIAGVPGLVLNGDATHNYPGILNVSISDIEGESLLLALEPLCVATGSACNSLNQEPSYVLRALGRSDDQAQSSIRFSIGRMTTAADIDFAIAGYRAAIEKLRQIAPEWQA